MRRPVKVVWLTAKLISYLYLSIYSLVHVIEAYKTPLIVLWLAAFTVFIDLFCKSVDSSVEQQ